MIPMTVAEIAEVTGGALPGSAARAAADLTVTGPVVADSRAAGPGSLFVADAGGHAYAGDAVARGAVAVLGSRELPGLPVIVAPPTGTAGTTDPADPTNLADPAGRPDLALPDRDPSVLALGRLAHHVVERLRTDARRRGGDLEIVAITGSSGKTGTKDLAAQVLADPAAHDDRPNELIAPEASLNDELGVPLTVLRADATTRALVLEMGARGIGHLAYLTSLVRPTIAIVLNVGTAHIGEFGSKEGIAMAKGELVEALDAEGVAVLNADDALVRAMAARTRARVLLAGEAIDAQVRARDIELDSGGRPAFTLVTAQSEAPVRLNLVGRHQVANASSVAGAALATGLPLATVAERLSTATRRSRWRMEVTQRPDGVTLVNDAYNANPDSMRAALETVRAMAGDRRTRAVLGEMLELGAEAYDDHVAIGRLATALGYDHVIAVGTGGAPIGHGARQGATADGPEVSFVEDADAARALLEERLEPGDVVLVKSSRDAGLRYLGDAIAEGGTGPRGSVDAGGREETAR